MLAWNIYCFLKPIGYRELHEESVCEADSRARSADFPNGKVHGTNLVIEIPIGYRELHEEKDKI